MVSFLVPFAGTARSGEASSASQMSPIIGDQEKIVWRMTGTGALTLQAISPDGRQHPLACGPDTRGGSNWDKPGDEWGAGYVFTAPGCWDLCAIGGHATADVLIRVVAR